MKKLILFFSVMLISTSVLFSQNQTKKYQIPYLAGTTTFNNYTQSTDSMYIDWAHLKRCATAEADAYRMANDPEYKAAREKFNKDVENWIIDHPNYDPKTVITIPVVVHVIYKTAAECLTLTQVNEQIAYSNADFAGTNPHPLNAFASSLKANTNVQFCLATVDPSGNPTTGIDYKQTTVTSFYITGGSASCSAYPERCTSTGGAAAWDVTKYMNIWTCNAGSSLCGISEFPTSPNNVYYGTTINYCFFGHTGAQSPYNLGGTYSHECGHCLNLYHIWGDASGCSPDDQVTDTPTQERENYGNYQGSTLAEQGFTTSVNASTHVETETSGCQTSSPGVMYENFMDYTDDLDYANFTPGQTTRIAATLAGADAGYATSAATHCAITPAAPVAAFTWTPTSPVVNNTTTFTDQSTNIPTSWAWTFGDGGTSTAQNPTHTYTTTGTKSACLIATNSIGSSPQVCHNITVVAGGGTSCTQLLPPTQSLPCGDTAAYYKWSGGAGYVNGNDTYGDLEMAQKYYNSTSGTIDTVMAALKAIKNPAAGNIYCKIYSIDGTTKAPSAVLGTSDAVAYSTVSTSGGYVNFIFSSPIAVTGNFAASIVLPTGTGDTMVVYSTKVTCHGNDSLSWEWDGSKWYAFKSMFSTYGYNFDFFVFPDLCTITTNTNDMTSLGNNIAIYPNPTDNQFTVEFIGGEQKNVTVNVYNTTGVLVKSIAASNSTDHVLMDMSDIASGVYLVNIKTDEGTVIKKLSIIK